ncbi:MAG: electron transfer flavoprotein subunit beta/FixA family protein [Bacteroidales bacterium]|jgi:electron transfer flavoprotein beta subunit|nr:electron transfer flavoprotein subunit beta/FixA family protein [Bacteroidales bacterium]
MKKLNIVVLAKQVPDTRNVGKDAMKADGTVNRGALDAIFNPEDLNALEQALRIKETYGANVCLLTMGPPRAAEIIREAMFRGADEGILLTDRAFAGSDTLATSYAISQAIRKINPDMIIAGRQAIDGDTAQVGPQVAEKLNWPQITYTEEILKLSEKEIQIKRRLENGVEVVKSPMPSVITVTGSAPECRTRNAKLTMKYKHARTISELQNENRDYEALLMDKPHLIIKEWSVKEVDADTDLLGLSGSPTKVKKIENVVFTAKETRRLGDSEQEINELFADLIKNHTIG